MKNSGLGHGLDALLEVMTRLAERQAPMDVTPPDFTSQLAFRWESTVRLALG